MRINLENIPFLSKKAIPWIIWSIVGLYYFYEITLRVLPSTLRHEFIGIFQINATQFGLFASLYYWSYTFMQIPTGLIVDRFSIRKTLFVACLMCISGFFLIHISNQIGMAYIGRFVVGLGSAFAYVYALKVASIWLPRNHFGLATTIADSLGMLGVMFADTVFIKVTANSGIERTTSILIIAGLAIASLIFFVFRDKPDSEENIELNKQDTKDWSHIIDKILHIISKPQVWLIGLVGCLFYLPSSVIQDVWGIPYLHTVYHFSLRDSGYLISTMSFGWIIAGPILGAWSDKIKQRVMPMKLTILAAAILFSIVIFVPSLLGILLPSWSLFAIFFLIGAAMGTHPLVFALAKENFPNRVTGTAVAVTNTLTMIGGLIFQPIVGYIIDVSHHTVHATGAVNNYTANNFSVALSIVPILLLLAFITMFFIKETGSHIDTDVSEEEFLGPQYTINQNQPAIQGGGNVQTSA